MTPDDINKEATWLSVRIRLACVQSSDLKRLDQLVAVLRACADVVEAMQKDWPELDVNSASWQALAKLEELKP